MKAVLITRPGDPSVLAVREVADPVPGDGDLLVRVHAAAMNRADLLQRRGLYPAPAGTRNEIPGLEVAGVVEKTGTGAKGFRAGDRMMALISGEGYAERVVVPAVLAMPVPEHLDFFQAAAIPEVFITAYDALHLQLQVRAREKLLIHSVGSGVGSAAVQIARLAGVSTFGTAGSDEKLRRAQALGLEFPINRHMEDFATKVAELTGGNGVDVVLDLVGAPYWEKNLQALSTGGRMILVGLLGGSRVQTDLATVMRKRLRVIGTVLRPRTLLERAKLVRLFRENLLPLFEEGSLTPVVDRVFPLEQVAEAHQYMEENRNFGKVVLSVA